MDDAIFKVPTPQLLEKIVTVLDEMYVYPARQIAGSYARLNEWLKDMNAKVTDEEIDHWHVVAIKEKDNLRLRLKSGKYINTVQFSHKERIVWIITI